MFGVGDIKTKKSSQVWGTVSVILALSRQRQRQEPASAAGQTLAQKTEKTRIEEEEVVKFLLL